MIVRHEPWNILVNLDELVQKNARNTSAPVNGLNDAKMKQSFWSPVADIIEDKDKFIFTLDVPGVSTDDLDISVEDNMLTIAGKRGVNAVQGDATAENKPTLHRTERMMGTFERKFSLPESADTSTVAAQLQQGVLVIGINKKIVAQARKIKVEVNA